MTELATRTPEEAIHTEARVVDLQRSVAEKAATAALQAVELEHARIQAKEVKDASASARNLATVAGIAVDKILALTGRPQTVIEHRTIDDSVNRLQRLGLVIDGTAQDLTDEATRGKKAAKTLKAAPHAETKKPKNQAVPASSSVSGGKRAHG